MVPVRGVREDPGVSLIVAWKVTKATLALFGAGLLLRQAHGGGEHALIHRLADVFHFSAEAATARLTPGALGAGIVLLLGLAALYTIQAVGLHRRRRWAAWLTIIPTASLVPLEVWRLVHRPHPLRLAILVINLLILWYLAQRLRRHDLHETIRATPPPQSR